MRKHLLDIAKFFLAAWLALLASPYARADLPPTNYGSGGVQSMSCGTSGNLNNLGTALNPNCDLVASPSVTAVITGLTGTNLQQISNVAQTTTNASPSLLTMTGWNENVTSGSATALVFKFTMAHTYTNHPTCIFQPNATFAPVFPTVTYPSANECDLTFTTAPTAVLLGTLTVIANGP